MKEKLAACLISAPVELSSCRLCCRELDPCLSLLPHELGLFGTSEPLLRCFQCGTSLTIAVFQCSDPCTSRRVVSVMRELLISAQVKLDHTCTPPYPMHTAVLKFQLSISMDRHIKIDCAVPHATNFCELTASRTASLALQYTSENRSSSKQPTKEPSDTQPLTLDYRAATPHPT